jgi:hypothetical protein
VMNVCAARCTIALGLDSRLDPRPPARLQRRGRDRNWSKPPDAPIAKSAEAQRIAALIPKVAW